MPQPANTPQFQQRKVAGYSALGHIAFVGDTISPSNAEKSSMAMQAESIQLKLLVGI